MVIKGTKARKKYKRSFSCSFYWQVQPSKGFESLSGQSIKFHFCPIKVNEKQQNSLAQRERVTPPNYQTTVQASEQSTSENQSSVFSGKREQPDWQKKMF